MKDNTEDKDRLRKKIVAEKNTKSLDELQLCSQEVLSVVEITGVFQQAKTIFIYNNLNDEVVTTDFITKWSSTKDFYLPKVEKDNLVFRKYAAEQSFTKSAFGINEPDGEDFTNFDKVDLIIVPGMAFDRSKNRLGRGKGYYDRFLPKTKAPKMGICFDFQLIENVPTDSADIKMDYIVSENELIW